MFPTSSLESWTSFVDLDRRAAVATESASLDFLAQLCKKSCLRLASGVPSCHVLVLGTCSRRAHKAFFV